MMPGRRRPRQSIGWVRKAAGCFAIGDPAAGRRANLLSAPYKGTDYGRDRLPGRLRPAVRRRRRRRGWGGSFPGRL